MDTQILRKQDDEWVKELVLFPGLEALEGVSFFWAKGGGGTPPPKSKKDVCLVAQIEEARYRRALDAKNYATHTFYGLSLMFESGLDLTFKASLAAWGIPRTPWATGVLIPVVEESHPAMPWFEGVDVLIQKACRVCHEFFRGEDYLCQRCRWG